MALDQRYLPIVFLVRAPFTFGLPVPIPPVIFGNPDFIVRPATLNYTRPRKTIGDAVSCDIHGAQTIDSGSANVVCEGAPRARVGDVTTCTPPATITSGSANVEIN